MRLHTHPHIDLALGQIDLAQGRTVFAVGGHPQGIGDVLATDALLCRAENVRAHLDFRPLHCSTRGDVADALYLAQLRFKSGGSALQQIAIIAGEDDVQPFSAAVTTDRYPHTGQAAQTFTHARFHLRLFQCALVTRQQIDGQFRIAITCTARIAAACRDEHVGHFRNRA